MRDPLVVERPRRRVLVGVDRGALDSGNPAPHEPRFPLHRLQVSRRSVSQRAAWGLHLSEATNPERRARNRVARKGVSRGGRSPVSMKVASACAAGGASVMPSLEFALAKKSFARR